MCDVITIGSATMDVFVESDDANIVSVYTKSKKSEFMSYPYGAKVEIEDFTSQVGGGGVNTAVNFANLGYKTSAIFKIGDDIYSEGVLESFKNKIIIICERFSVFLKKFFYRRQKTLNFRQKHV